MDTLQCFLQFFQRDDFGDFLSKNRSFLNLIAFRKAKVEYNFGLSECNRVKGKIFLAIQP